MNAGAVNVVEAGRGVMAEMGAIVAMPIVAAVGVVEGAVVAPIAVIERAVEAVVIAVIIITHADAHRDMLAAGTALLDGAAGYQDSRQSGRDRQDFAVHIR